MSDAASYYLQGGVEVDKDIRFADKAVYFPWRPRCILWLFQMHEEF